MTVTAVINDSKTGSHRNPGEQLQPGFVLVDLPTVGGFQFGPDRVKHSVPAQKWETAAAFHRCWSNWFSSRSVTTVTCILLQDVQTAWFWAVASSATCFDLHFIAYFNAHRLMPHDSLTFMMRDLKYQSQSYIILSNVKIRTLISESNCHNVRIP